MDTESSAHMCALVKSHLIGKLVVIWTKPSEIISSSPTGVIQTHRSLYALDRVE